MAITEHARIFRPSAMKRIVECPISAYLSYDLPEQEDTSYTIEGTLAHDVAEWFTEDLLSGKPYRKITDPKYDKDMKRHGKAYAEYVHDIVKPYLHLEHVWFIEHRVSASEDEWGTIDFIFMYFDENGDKQIIIIDYKYGVGVSVESETNWQIIAYAKCVAVQYRGNSGLKPVKGVEFHIFQPRTDHETPPQKLTIEELDDQFFPIIDAAIEIIKGWLETKHVSQEDMERYQRVGSHCDNCFCQARPICKPYIAQKGGNKALALFKEVAKKAKEVNPEKKSLTASMLEDKKLYVDNGVISPEDLAFIALNATYINGFVKGAKNAAYELAKQGIEFKNAKMIRSQGQRGYISDLKTVVKELKRLGIEEPVKKVVEEKLISMSEAEKRLGPGKIDHILTRGEEDVYKLVPVDHPAPRSTPGLKTASMFRSLLKDSVKTKPMRK